MKIVIFGLTVSSSWGNGHATLWRGLLKALAQRGHRAIFYERDVPYYAATRDLTALPGEGILRLYSEFSEIESEAERQLADADLAITTSYCPDGIVAGRLVLDSGAAIKSYYDLDTPVTLARLKAGEQVDYVPAGGLGPFDLVLSYTGGPALDELQMLLGAQKVAPLYGSVDPESHYPVPPCEDFRCDLSYLGTYAEDRQAALEELFIRPAAHQPEKKFLIGGAQYPQSFPWTPNIYFVRHMPPPLHPAFFCSSRATLNVTRRAMADYGYCPSGRLFEAAACGVPLLSDEWQGIDDFFTPGSEVLIVKDSAAVESALALSDEELQRIAAAARERALNEHTAAHRVLELEALCASLPQTAVALL